mgnify:CR=1 FL=1|tara:strand:- start:29790 stop:30011 length:222 start_codon:yes stop_codon:yes gene_type:complete
MQYLEGVLLALGLVLVLMAYGHYLWRTGDFAGVVRFWTRGMVLSVAEFKLQRAGIALLIVAVVVRFCRALFLI